ncbi:MAG TPA: hypothetical protein PKE49_18915, partial [Leptospiraceae bacterium]|nr:hypothetical protein [Leptospiraceae bacterium]
MKRRNTIESFVKKFSGSQVLTGIVKCKATAKMIARFFFLDAKGRRIARSFTPWPYILQFR